MARIGFVVHHGRPRSDSLAIDTIAWLHREGHEAFVLDGDPSADVDRAVADLDLAVSLGGDGTMLRTVHLVAPAKVPVLGVNVGHLGYLTTVEPEGLREALSKFLAGSYRLDTRMTLDVTVWAPDGTEILHASALNDVVLQRPVGLHTVRAELAVNGADFVSFVADSLIIATPTGSTAYNFSARGPIVSPRARVQIVTPVAAHMLFDRSLVLDAGEEIAVTPTENQPADIVVDGRPAVALRPGHTLRCKQGEADALLVTFGERDFHHILRAKFKLADR
ncbi:MAG: NAD(+)/NADH kinase [Acidimicrobiaceae bacterium]|nr:NAD(+)/NADH kinase [Acidimicrobiaceae bacterium]